MKKIVFAALTLALSFGFLGKALAVDIVSPGNQDPNVVIGAAETHKNLYTAGANVAVNGNVTGDLTAAGGMVTIDGNVEQELLLAGGMLNVSGAIGNTARIAGGNITISGPVGGDLVVAGGNIHITGKASVAGDLLIGGGNVIIDAPVKGTIRMAGGSVSINSTVGGNVYAQTSQSLVFGPGANVSGTVFHKGNMQAQVKDGAKVGTINFTQINTSRAGRGLAGLLTIAFLIRLLAWIIVAFLLYHFKKSWVLQTYEGVQTRPWPNLGWGLVYAIIIPVVAVLALITFVGYYTALIIGVGYFMLVLVAKIFAAITLGFLILRRLSKPNDAIPMWQPIVIGTVIWSVLGLIPFIGWIIIAVLFLMTFGSFLSVAKNALKE